MIDWGRKYESRIDDLRALRYEQILEKYKLTQEDRLTRLAQELKLAWESFEQKGYEDLSKREVMLIIMRLEQSLRKEPAMIAKAKKKDEENEPEIKIIQIRRPTIGGDKLEKYDQPVRTLIFDKNGKVIYNHEKTYYGTEDEVTEMLEEEEKENEAYGNNELQ